MKLRKYKSPSNTPLFRRLARQTGDRHQAHFVASDAQGNWGLGSTAAEARLDLRMEYVRAHSGGRRG